MRMTRSKGAVGGFVLLVLGLWGALIPFLGPYFNYGFSPNATWHFTLNRLWLSILPGAAVALGGLILLVSRRRSTLLAGGWLALLGGAWMLVGPSVSLLWIAGGGGLAHSGIGAPIGGHDRAAVELLGFFYLLGAVITAIATFEVTRLLSAPWAAREPWSGRRSAAVAPAPGAPMARMPEREGAPPPQEAPAAGTAEGAAAGRPGEEAPATREPVRRY